PDPFRLGQAQLYGDPAPTLRIGLQRTPVRDTAAGRAEVEAERLAADVRLRRPRDVDRLAVVVVRPEGTVAAASGAVARRRRLGRAVEAPANRAAVAGSVDHAAIVAAADQLAMAASRRCRRRCAIPATTARPPISSV